MLGVSLERRRGMGTHPQIRKEYYISIFAPVDRAVYSKRMIDEESLRTEVGRLEIAKHKKPEAEAAYHACSFLCTLCGKL